MKLALSSAMHGSLPGQTVDQKAVQQGMQSVFPPFFVHVLGVLLRLQGSGNLECFPNL